MSFLAFDDKTPTTNATFKALKAEEYLYKDPESGSYIPLVPGGGGAPSELPYYAKPALVDFTVDSLRATMDQTGVDVIDTVGNTASELTSTALTIGDVNGNASLGKASIEAANNLKDAIAAATTSNAPTTQSVLTYDSSNGKVSKSNSLRLFSDYSGYSTITPYSIAMQNGSSYMQIAGSNLYNYNSSMNNAGKLSGGTLALGSRLSSTLIDSTLPNTNLDATSLKIFDGTTTHALTAPTVQAANNLKDAISGDITDETNASQNVLIYDASSAKVSKASTFRLNESATEYSTFSPFTVSLKNGNNYSMLTTGNLTTYYAPSNVMSVLSAGTIAIGSRGADFNLDTSLPNCKILKSSLKLFDGSTTHTLDAPAIKAATNLATVSTTTPAAENKMVVFNPTTSSYAYHDVPAGISLPSYIQPTKILMRGVNASFAEKGIELVPADAAGTKSIIKVTDGDTSSTSPSVSVTGTGLTFHPASPDDYNDRTLEYGDVNRVKNGWNVLTAVLKAPPR